MGQQQLASQNINLHVSDHERLLALAAERGTTASKLLREAIHQIANDPKKLAEVVLALLTDESGTVQKVLTENAVGGGINVAEHDVEGEENGEEQ